MLKYSQVTCGECLPDPEDEDRGKALFVFCEWPPTFYYCRDCHRTFTFQAVKHTDGIIWQLRGYPQ